MMATWYERLERGDEALRERVQRLRKVREIVGPWLEQLRRDKTIGASLAAEITLEATGRLAEELQAVGDELRFLFISSDVHLAPVAEPMETAEIDGDSLKVAVRPSEHAKCVRCWHHRDSVGSDDRHPELCGRCVDNIEGPGETRVWG